MTGNYDIQMSSLGLVIICSTRWCLCNKQLTSGWENWLYKYLGFYNWSLICKDSKQLTVQTDLTMLMVRIPKNVQALSGCVKTSSVIIFVIFSIVLSSYREQMNCALLNLMNTSSFPTYTVVFFAILQNLRLLSIF